MVLHAATSFRMIVVLLIFVPASKGFVPLVAPAYAETKSTTTSQSLSRVLPFQTKIGRAAQTEEDEDDLVDNDQTNINDDDNTTTTSNNTNAVVIYTEILLPVPRERAFDAFSNLSRQSEWSPWLKSVEYTSPQDTVWKMRRFLGLRYSWTAKTTRFERPCLLEWESTRGVKNLGQVVFEEEPTKTYGKTTLMKLTLSVSVPRLVSKVLGENSRMTRFIKVAMVQKSLKSFKVLLLEEQQQEAAKIREEEKRTSPV